MPCARPASTCMRFSAWFWTRANDRVGNFLASRWQPRWYSMQAQNDQPRPGANRRSKSAHVAGESSFVVYLTIVAIELRCPFVRDLARLGVSVGIHLSRLQVS